MNLVTIHRKNHLTLFMPKSLSILLLLAASLSACVTPPVPDAEGVSDLELVNESIVSLEQTLEKQFAKNCARTIDDLGDKVEKLRRAKETTRVIERCSKPSAKKTNVKLDGKLLMGDVETVLLTKEEIKFDARIDTGAETSSIGVYNHKPFERDGKKWVRFLLTQKKDAKVYEYPVYDRVKIKQTETVTEERIEIKMDIELGGKKYKKQIFNLANRSFLEYQLLIGRSFLRDIAIVDVGRKKLLPGD